MWKKEIIKSKILENVNSLDIAWYLKEEIEKSLEYFHYYKLNNILKNIDFLDDYLSFLDKKNTTQINDLYCELSQDIDIWVHDLMYYVSNKWLKTIWENTLKCKIVEGNYGFLSILQWIKWFLLLTLDEFCNATPVRLSIDQVVRLDTDKKNANMYKNLHNKNLCV